MTLTKSNFGLLSVESLASMATLSPGTTTLELVGSSESSSLSSTELLKYFFGDITSMAGGGRRSACWTCFESKWGHLVSLFR